MSEGFKNIGPKGVEIKIELPFEVAEYILNNSEGLLKTLQKVVTIEKARFEKSKLATEFQTPENINEWEKLARYVDKEARRRFKQNKEPFNSVLSGLAKELGVPYTTLQALVANYRQKRSEKLKKRREVEIIRLYLLGWSNSRIGKSLTPSMGSDIVGRFVEENRDILGTLKKYKTELNKNTKKPKIITQKTKKDAAKIDRKSRVAAIAIRHKKIGIKLYREYRKHGISKGNQRYHLIKNIAKPYNLPFNFASNLISKRRKEVLSYIKLRKSRTIFQFYKQGLNNKEIASKTGLHDRTVAKIVREVRASK